MFRSVIFFFHSDWGRKGWCARVQVPPLACEGPGRPWGGVSVWGHGGRTQRSAFLLPIHSHGGHWSPQTRLHHLPPVAAASPPGGLCDQLVSDVCVQVRRRARWVRVTCLCRALTTQDLDPRWQKGRVHGVLGWWRTGHWTHPAAEGVWCWTQWHNQYYLQKVPVPWRRQRHSKWIDRAKHCGWKTQVRWCYAGAGCPAAHLL